MTPAPFYDLTARLTVDPDRLATTVAHHRATLGASPTLGIREAIGLDAYAALRDAPAVTAVTAITVTGYREPMVAVCACPHCTDPTHDTTPGTPDATTTTAALVSALAALGRHTTARRRALVIIDDLRLELYRGTSLTHDDLDALGYALRLTPTDQETTPR